MKPSLSDFDNRRIDDTKFFGKNLVKPIRVYESRHVGETRIPVTRLSLSPVYPRHPVVSILDLLGSSNTIIHLRHNQFRKSKLKDSYSAVAAPDILPLEFFSR